MNIGKYNFHIGGQLLPTPPEIKVAGNALATASTFAAGLIATTGNTKLAIIIIAVGFIGKFLSDFFSNINTTSQVINKPSSEPVTATVVTEEDGSKTLVQ